MKSARWIIALSSIVIITACSNKDSEFFNEITVEVPNQLVLETQSTYAVQDILWLHTAFSRYLPETGYNNLLDVYQTSGQAPSFMFSFILEKKVADGSWEFYSLNTNLIEDNGIPNQYDGYYLGYSIYNETSKTFDFRAGLKLTETGQYRLNFGYDSLLNRSVVLRSNSTSKNTVVNIRSRVDVLDASGYYTFTVN
jgi:hypothetical protein